MVERVREEELKPCPFGCDSGCGVVQTLNAFHAVICWDCKALGPTEKERSNAIAAWNKRPGQERRAAPQDKGEPCYRGDCPLKPKATP